MRKEASLPGVTTFQGDCLFPCVMCCPYVIDYRVRTLRVDIDLLRNVTCRDSEAENSDGSPDLLYYCIFVDLSVGLSAI